MKIGRSDRYCRVNVRRWTSHFNIRHARRLEYLSVSTLSSSSPPLSLSLSPASSSYFHFNYSSFRGLFSTREKNEVNNTKIYLFSGNKSPRGLRANVYYANRDVISIGAATFPFLFLFHVSFLFLTRFFFLFSSLSRTGGTANHLGFFAHDRSRFASPLFLSVFLGDGARGWEEEGLWVDLTGVRFSETTRDIRYVNVEWRISASSLNTFYHLIKFRRRVYLSEIRRKEETLRFYTFSRR